MGNYKAIFKNDTITLSKHIDKNDFWLYDYTRGMNLSMKAKTERDAFVEALTYYQKRLLKVETDFKVLNDKVSTFVSSVVDEEFLF